LYKGEKKEADFRYQLIRTRENAEAIAMYDAGDFEKDGILKKFEKIVHNTKEMIFREMKIVSFVSFYNQTAVILPILVLAPKYFVAAITLGVLMQTIKAFDEIKTALSWMIESYISIATLKAVIERLYGFQNNMKECKKQKNNQRLQIKFEGEEIKLNNLEIYLPSGDKILEKTTKVIFKNNYILTGKNGSGKKKSKCDTPKNACDIHEKKCDTPKIEENMPSLFLQDQVEVVELICRLEVQG
jgi:putative ATP-binding cassette transporter